VANNRNVHDRNAAWQATRDAAIAKKREEREAQLLHEERCATAQARRGPKFTRRSFDNFLRREHAWEAVRRTRDVPSMGGVIAAADGTISPCCAAEPTVPIVAPNGRFRYSSRVTDGELLRYLDGMEATL
jgi:hypothetical protein